MHSCGKCLGKQGKTILAFTFAMFWKLYVFFSVIPRRLNFICRRFGTLYLFHVHRQVGMPMKMEQIECSKTSAYKIQTLGNYPKENIQGKTISQWTNQPNKPTKAPNTSWTEVLIVITEDAHKHKGAVGEVWVKLKVTLKQHHPVEQENQ